MQWILCILFLLLLLLLPLLPLPLLLFPLSLPLLLLFILGFCLGGERFQYAHCGNGIWLGKGDRHTKFGSMGYVVLQPRVIADIAAASVAAEAVTGGFCWRC